ncbi:caspase Dronc isoform X2 [Procambarus clarkii]|uniref:caspase Dronc isoform X2 n=1 Tax=Procambarus clarkii TaxID=6728 RepID=UPI001E6714E5|nr:caspase-2-like isoform X2 [Procambarus clarkii]
MDATWRRILREHKDAIAEALVHTEMTQHIIYELREEGVLTSERAEAFKMETTKTTRMKNLISYLETCGEGAFQKLLKVLMQLGLSALVMRLNESINEEHSGNLGGNSNELEDLTYMPNIHIGQPGQLPTLPRPPCRRPEMPEYHMVESGIPNEPLIIDVVPYREVGGQDLEPASVYKNLTMPRGLVFMANFKNFNNDEHSPRTGSETDVKNLTMLFSQMGYSIPNVHLNMKKYETIKALREFQALDDLNYVDSCIVVIMSHGRDEKSFYTSDNNFLSVNDVVERFSNKECPALQGKPKIFIFQYCRGTAPDIGVPPVPQPVMHSRALDVQTDSAHFGEAIIDRHPTYTDMYIAYSTVEGFVSFRHPKRGSWLMEAICFVFMNNACDHELDSLMKMVSRRVRDNYTDDGNKQVCEFVNRAFDRHFFFNPEPLRNTGLLNMSTLSNALSDSRSLENAASPLPAPAYCQKRHTHCSRGTIPVAYSNNNYRQTRHRNLSWANNASERSLEEHEPLNLNPNTALICPRVSSLSGARPRRRTSLPETSYLHHSTPLPRRREARGRANSEQEQAQELQEAATDPPEILNYSTGSDVFIEDPQDGIETPSEDPHDVVDTAQFSFGVRAEALPEHMSRESPLRMTGGNSSALIGEVQRGGDHEGILHSQSTTTIILEYEEEELNGPHMAIKRQNSAPSSNETLEKIDGVRKFLQVHDSEEMFKEPLRRIESFVKKRDESKRIKLDRDDSDNLEQ